MSRLGLTRRVAKLEQSEVFAGPQQLMARLDAAKNGSALRLTGKLYRAVRGDAAIRERIFTDVQDRFLRNLSDAELDSLIQSLRGDMTDADLDRLEAGCRRANKVPVAEW
jgi:hypothetical protein